MPKIKRKLDKKEPTIKPPFNMAEPNDDLHAFGWDMGRIRYPSNDSVKGDVWPGRNIFDIDTNNALREQYGFDINFLNGKYLQVLLDSSPKIMAACQKAAAEDYSEEAIANIRRVVLAEFRDRVIPDMAARFKKIAGMIGNFYAARMAHVQTFGAENET